MIWRYNVQDLDYYQSRPNELCYCETLAYPSDLTLQGHFTKQTGYYELFVEVWDESGTVFYENALPYFDWCIADNPLRANEQFFNLQLKTWSPAMCANKCFVIKALIVNRDIPTSVVFGEAWTEKYCIKDCCDEARGITITQDGFVVATQSGLVPANSNPAVTLCGEPLLRLITKVDCYDPFFGDYYGMPENVSIGSTLTFPFVKISTFKGRLRQRPREISIERSYNCRIQRAESARQYLLEGFELFPSWKMDELEVQLHGNQIWVDDFNNYKEYIFNGGVALKQIVNGTCYDTFKLEATINDCTKRITYGCVVSCAPQNTNYYVIPSNYAGGLFYNQSCGVIADLIYEPSPAVGTSLITWFQSQGLNAELVDASPVSCDYTAIIAVTPNTSSVIPSTIYYDSCGLNTQIQVLNVSLEDICDYIPQGCDAPVIGTITDSDMPCDAPVIGVITDSDITPTDLTFYDYNDWAMVIAAIENKLELYGNSILFGLDTIKAGVPYVIGDDVPLVNEQIGFVTAAAIPSVAKVFDSTNSDLTGDQTITVNTDGFVYFNGTITVTVDNELEITFTNLYYTL